MLEIATRTQTTFGADLTGQSEVMIVARCVPIATGGGVSADARSALKQFIEILRSLGIPQTSAGRLTWYVRDSAADCVDIEELLSIKLAGVNADDTDVQFVQHLSRADATIELDAVTLFTIRSCASNPQRKSEAGWVSGAAGCRRSVETKDDHRFRIGVDR